MLRDRLRAATGKDVRLQFRTDAEIIGGVVTRIGSLVYNSAHLYLWPLALLVYALAYDERLVLQLALAAARGRTVACGAVVPA